MRGEQVVSLPLHATQRGPRTYMKLFFCVTYTYMKLERWKSMHVGRVRWPSNSSGRNFLINGMGAALRIV